MLLLRLLLSWVQPESLRRPKLRDPFYDNGIKLFGPDGYKLSDAIEAQIEDAMGNNLDHARVESEQLGRAKRLEDAGGRYIEFAKNTFPRGLRLDGLKIVVDCGNGIPGASAPGVLRPRAMIFSSSAFMAATRSGNSACRLVFSPGSFARS